MKAAMLVLFAMLGLSSAEEVDAKSGKPESPWLTIKFLANYMQQLGYEAEEVNDRLVLTLTPSNPKKIFAEFSDQDSLKLTATWDSPQKELGDGPIVNTWNNERRFCKVSINENAVEGESKTLMVMHLDQLLFTAGGEADMKPTEYLIRKAVETMKAGVLEFDLFARDTYLTWQKQWRSNKEL